MPNSGQFAIIRRLEIRLNFEEPNQCNQGLNLKELKV
jgi:hypothetical protein